MFPKHHCIPVIVLKLKKKLFKDTNKTIFPVWIRKYFGLEITRNWCKYLEDTDMEIQTYLQASKENSSKIHVVQSWVKWEILILLDMLGKYPNSWLKSIIISSKKGPLFLVETSKNILEQFACYFRYTYYAYILYNLLIGYFIIMTS